MIPYKFIASLLLPALAVSCIRSDYGDCEPAGPADRWKHVVSVTDKNYSNVAQFEEAVAVVDESLPFSFFVSSLTLWRHNAALPDYQVYNAIPGPTGSVYDLSVEFWPTGVNRVTAIGNETVSSQTFGPSATIDLHPQGREHRDIYMGTADVPIPPTADVNIIMHRVKGELVMFMDDIPQSADSIYITVDNVYETIDAQMSYSGSTSVTKGFKVTGTDMVLTLILSPTVGTGTSNVSITRVDADGGRHSRDITSIVLGHNELSGIREQIDTADGHVVYVYANGEWSRVTPLDVITE